MASGGGGSGGEDGGRKRKASPEPVAAPVRREPRRGLGVAELERMRVAIEVAERCYAAVSSLSSSAPAPLPPPPALHHPTTMAYQHQHHHHHLPTAGDVTPRVGNGAVRRRHHHQPQMPRSYLTAYRLPQHYGSDDPLTSRMFTSNAGGHPSSVQQRHQQPAQIQSAATAFPVTAAQSASSQSSSSGNQLLPPWQQARRRAAPPRQMAAVPPPHQQVAFVDLVDDSDDDTEEELDLELKL